MSDLPERHAHWQRRTGLVDVGRVPVAHTDEALARSLATMHQAVLVFEHVKETLGDRAYLDPSGGELHQVLFVRDPEHPEWLVPEPLLHLSFVQTSVTLAKVRVRDGVGPETAPAAVGRPDIVPRGPDMRLGSLFIREGGRELTVDFDERGMRAGGRRTGGDGFRLMRHPTTRPFAIDPTARPPTPLPISLLLRADLDRSGHAPEALARMIVELDPHAHVPGRVHVPVPVPCGAAGAWAVGRGAIRDALYRGDVPESARFVLADGFAGTAVAWGSTRDEALAAWDAAVFRAKPKPPRPESLPPVPLPRPGTEGPSVVKDEERNLTTISTGMVTVSFGGGPAMLDWPAAVPKNMPAAAIPLPPLPEAIPEALHAAGFTRWVRLVGDLGAVSHALRRDSTEATTLIGEGVVDLVDVASLDVELDRELSDELAMLPDTDDFPHPARDQRMRCHVSNHSLWDHGHQRACPLNRTGGYWGGGFAPRELDGDMLRWSVTRIRRLHP